VGAAGAETKTTKRHHLHGQHLFASTFPFASFFIPVEKKTTYLFSLMKIGIDNMQEMSDGLFHPVTTILTMYATYLQV
jgi:hypothetical protein